MHARKLFSLLLLALLAVTVLAGCAGRSDFSKEAVQAANNAQNTVTFQTDSQLTRALQDALADNIQTNDVRNAMAADKNLQTLLTDGCRLDVFAVRADSAKAAAESIAQNIASITAGKKPEGRASMVLADNGYYYAAVLTWRDTSSSSDNDDEPPAPPEIESITVTKSPNKTAYVVGQTFDPSGLTLEIHYGDGTSETLEYSADSGITWSPSRALTEKDTTITIAFAEKTTEITIQVEPVKVSSISINTSPKKIEYIEDEKFDPDGLSILVEYNNGEKDTVAYSDDSGISYAPADPLTAQNTTVTITYEGQTTELEITVYEDSGIGTVSGLTEKDYQEIQRVMNKHVSNNKELQDLHITAGSDPVMQAKLATGYPQEFSNLKNVYYSNNYPHSQITLDKFKEASPDAPTLAPGVSEQYFYVYSQGSAGLAPSVDLITSIFIDGAFPFPNEYGGLPSVISDIKRNDLIVSEEGYENTYELYFCVRNEDGVNFHRQAVILVRTRTKL